jgi:hypothetical protein
MKSTSVLGARSAAAVDQTPSDGDRPDVGLLLGVGDDKSAIRAAIQKAADTGGSVCVLRCLDNTGIRSSRELISRSAAARSQLARVVSESFADGAGPRVTERLHIGTLQSLLRGLPKSIGVLVVASPLAPETRRILRQCPVPQLVVDPRR